MATMSGSGLSGALLWRAALCSGHSIRASDAVVSKPTRCITSIAALRQRGGRGRHDTCSPATGNPNWLKNSNEAEKQFSATPFNCQSQFCTAECGTASSRRYEPCDFQVSGYRTHAREPFGSSRQSGKHKILESGFSSCRHNKLVEKGFRKLVAGGRGRLVVRAHGRHQSGHAGRTGQGPLAGDRIWTTTMIVINVLIFAASWYSHGRLYRWGAKVNYLIAMGQWHRLLAPALLHADIAHLVVNCISLNNVGPFVEGLAGGMRFLAIYWTAAFAGFYMSFVYSRHPSVGASGAIMGLVGAQLVFYARHWGLFGSLGRSQLSSLAQMVVLNLVLGSMWRNVDNWGHLGGLLGGALAAWVLGPVYGGQLGRLVELSPRQRLGLEAKP